MRIVIIGSGIVALHLARLILKKNHEVFVLEKESFFAEHSSGRNSGVVHAGIFYQQNSLKEQLCLRGNSLTYEILENLNLPFQKEGKLVTFSEHQMEEQNLFENKLNTLQIPFKTLKSVDPLLENLNVHSAVHIQTTGIVDAASYVNAMVRSCEDDGVQILKNCEVTDFDDQKIYSTRGEIEYDFLFNSAGLWADHWAQKDGLNYEIRPCRGDYYLINQVLHPLPIYPFPDPNAPGLGVHLTPNFDHQTLIGPNAFFIEEKANYAHLSQENEFIEGTKALVKKSDLLKLQIAYSGNRPKLYKKNQAVYDFTIEKVNNRVHLLGIESPGLTAAPALAEYCLQLI